MWLVFSNGTHLEQPLKLTIEYTGGKDMVENFVVGQGTCEAQDSGTAKKWRVVRIDMAGYAGLVLHV